MKKIMMIAALAACTTGFAQNTDEVEVETVKKTIVTDDDGVRVNTKRTNTTKETELALGERKSYHNFNTVMKPGEVNTDVAYYRDGMSFRFMPAKNGYNIVDEKNTELRRARLYPTSQKGYYLYNEEGNSSFGYFNEDGDFVVESYDQDGDGVLNYVYKLKMNQDAQKKMKKKKMKMMKEKM